MEREDTFWWVWRTMGGSPEHARDMG